MKAAMAGGKSRKKKWAKGKARPDPGLSGLAWPLRSMRYAPVAVTPVVRSGQARSSSRIREGGGWVTSRSPEGGLVTEPLSLSQRTKRSEAF